MNWKDIINGWLQYEKNLLITDCVLAFCGCGLLAVVEKERSRKTLFLEES